jgi:YfiH family protein
VNPAARIEPAWPAPRGVRAFVTTKPIDLGVPGDRAALRPEFPSEPRWMKQVHGAAVADLDTANHSAPPTADAAVTRMPGRVAVVLVADCMPVFLSDTEGTRVGIAHAGWRGMAAGVIENTVRAMDVDPARVIAWMGPAIGPEAFEVGEEVLEAFTRADAKAREAFRPGRPGKHFADLYALARQRLASAGVARISGGGFCTFNDAARFFSYRRGGERGRMGAFIWREAA